ncbi:MAG TPA: hypothetical protein VI338_05175 [Nitrososphaera sp.]|nr:hypothetical protein [Nitrososphaera sp.]
MRGFPLQTKILHAASAYSKKQLDKVWDFFNKMAQGFSVAI